MLFRPTLKLKNRNRCIFGMDSNHNFVYLSLASIFRDEQQRIAGLNSRDFKDETAVDVLKKPMVFISYAKEDITKTLRLADPTPACPGMGSDYPLPTVSRSSDYKIRV